MYARVTSSLRRFDNLLHEQLARIVLLRREQWKAADGFGQRWALYVLAVVTAWSMGKEKLDDAIETQMFAKRHSCQPKTSTNRLPRYFMLFTFSFHFFFCFFFSFKLAARKMLVRIMLNRRN